MNSAEVSTRLADRFVRLLAKRRTDTDSALATWSTATSESRAARDRANAARDAAKAADGDDEEAELTRRAIEFDADAERTARAARGAYRALAEAVNEAELETLRARSDAGRMAPEDARRVERAAYVATEHARAAREKAGLGPSIEDAELTRRLHAEWDAAARAAAEETATASVAPATVAPAPDAVTEVAAPPLTREAHALGLLAQNPTIKVAELARLVGVDRRTIYRWPQVETALRVRRGGRASRKVQGRSYAEAAAIDDERPKIARSSRERPRSRDY